MVGRIEEIRQLEKLYSSGRSEFVAVYGRRRVGKTYLVKEVFRDRLVFWHTGVSPYDGDGGSLMEDQLRAFHYNLIRYGLEEKKCPDSWIEAFNMLGRLVESKTGDGKKVIFIDELPWMDTPRARFIPALENFFNDWVSKRDDIMLVVCGSATSWIEDKLIHSKGGLYRRLTDTIHLKPFSLAECREYYESQGIRMSDYDIAQSYMVMGGIPFYMSFLDRELSLAQNIDRLFFAEGAKLEDEFDLLLGSLFVNPEQYRSIIKFLARRHGGYTRTEIVQGTGLPDGGGLTQQLKALIASNFITKYVPFGEKKSKVHFKLSDSFCRFWLTFKESGKITDTEYWQHNSNSQALNVWRGIAFEELCLNNIRSIKKALEIGGVSTNESSLSVKCDDTREGSQIDLIIERADNVVNLCEMKFYNDEFKVTKEYNRKLNQRLNLVSELIPKRKVVHMTLITTEGLAKNEYSGIFQKTITLDALFQ